MTFDCTRCGACCVGAPAACTEQEAAAIPKVLVAETPVGRFVRQEHGRCAALLGYLGTSVACVLYDVRPRCCREFEVGGAACFEARAARGVTA